MKHRQHLTSHRATTTLALIILVCSVAFTIFAIVSASAYGVLGLTVPLGAFAIIYLKASPKLRARIETEHTRFKEFAGAVWLVGMLVSAVVLFLAIIFGADWVGEFTVEAIRFLTNSD